jgi:tetratricopeptide (TPR) repeat protein
MKTVFKVLASGMMLMAFAVAPAFAQQQEECEALYKKYMDNYKGPAIAQRKTAVEAGEQYIAKCASLDAEITKYLEKAIPPIKKKIDFEESAAAFDVSVKDAKNVNADVAFTSGKRLLTNHDPNMIDVMLVLASVGFDKAVAKPPVDTYNADAINFARQAIQKIEGGTASKQFGAWGYTYKTKENALAWMNYTIGYITYYNQKNKKDALPYLYKATKYETGGKDNPKNNALIYQAIGDYYRDEYNRLDDERAKLATDAKDKTPEEVKVLADKSKELLLLQKGYADRMIDAYGRAYGLAADQTYKTGLLGDLKVLYTFRYDNKPPAALETYISGLNGKPMPDPTSTVTPVVDTTTTATTTPASTGTLTKTTTAPTTGSTTNGRTSMTETTSVKEPTTTTTKAKTAKTPAKTPAPKKKGTR